MLSGQIRPRKSPATDVAVEIQVVELGLILDATDVVAEIQVVEVQVAEIQVAQLGMVLIRSD